MLADLPQLWSAASADPVMFYSLASAVLLAVVSWYSGLSRLDVVALLNPRNLLRVVGCVALAFVLRALSETTTLPPGSLAATLLAGLHRLPLYVVALAYGPSAGLLAAGLFSAFASSTLLPGLDEAVLALELVVLGWLAIYPSPRTTRWAGPVNAALAYVLAWGTAGIAVMTARGIFVDLGTLAVQHAAAWPGVAVSCLLLAVIGPGAYHRAFPGSRIAHRHPGSTAAAHTAANLALQTHELSLLPEVAHAVDLDDDRHPRLRPAFSQGVSDVPRVRARVVKRLSPRQLPEDSFER